MFQQLYRKVLRKTESIPQRIELIKTNIAESIAINRKKILYNSVTWTEEQQKEFDDFWLEAYGKKISNKWHRLYQAVSGKFCVDYVPEKLYSTVIEPYFNDRRYAVVLQDKSLIESLSSDCGCVVPETVVVCSNGLFFNRYREPISIIEAIEAIQNSGSIVMKPTIGSSSGKGILFLNTPSCESEKEMEGIIRQFGRDFIVQKRILQHASYAAFNPTSINTIRITTFLVDGEIHHMPLAFRIGRENKNVDNIHAGGLGVGVKDDGELLSNAYSLGYGNKNEKYNHHPDSKIIFAHYHLPFIDKIIQSSYKFHGKLPHIGIVSWDYSVDVHGIPVLIEANIMGQGIWFPQMIWGKGPFGENTKEILSEVSKSKRNKNRSPN